VPAAAAALKRAVEEHLRVARAAPPGPGRHAAIVAGLAEQLRRGVEAHGGPVGAAAARALFEVDLELNAQGLEVWLDARPAA
jgi:hypothetical protein